MASAFNRGTVAEPRWYARWKGADGEWHARRSFQASREESLKMARDIEAKVQRVKMGLEVEETPGKPAGPLIKKWMDGLDNASRDSDVSRIERFVLPRWKNTGMDAIDGESIEAWRVAMVEAGVTAPTRRRCYGLLSRFMSWAVEQGHVKVNPCYRAWGEAAPIPRCREDPAPLTEEQEAAFMDRLGQPFADILFVGRKTGLRLGRILELSVAEAEAIDVLAPIAARRRAAGAEDDNWLFTDTDGTNLERHQVAFRWRMTRTALSLPTSMTFDAMAKPAGQRTERPAPRTSDVKRIVRSLLIEMLPAMLDEAVRRALGANTASTPSKQEEIRASRGLDWDEIASIPGVRLR